VSDMAGLLKEPGEDQRVPHVDLEQQMIWVLGKGRRFRGVPFGPKTGLSAPLLTQPFAAPSQGLYEFYCPVPFGICGELFHGDIIRDNSSGRNCIIVSQYI
jgi:hypothetical protein